MNEIVISTANVSIKEYQGNRVVTFKDIDTVHSRPDGTAKRNFNRNKEHFIENEDYFVRNSYEAQKEYNITAPNGLVLLTESGYLMLAKSFTDKKAWEVQRVLVNSYFRVDKNQECENKIVSFTEQHHFIAKEIREKAERLIHLSYLIDETPGTLVPLKTLEAYTNIIIREMKNIASCGPVTQGTWNYRFDVAHKMKEKR